MRVCVLPAYRQAVWYLKTRALTMMHWVDDTDFEEEGVADMLLDENATAALPRPGTSLSRPQTGAVMGVPGQASSLQQPTAHAPSRTPRQRSLRLRVAPPTSRVRLQRAVD